MRASTASSATWRSKEKSSRRCSASSTPSKSSRVPMPCLPRPSTTARRPESPESNSRPTARTQPPSTAPSLPCWRSSAASPMAPKPSSFTLSLKRTKDLRAVATLPVASTRTTTKRATITTAKKTTTITVMKKTRATTTTETATTTTTTPTSRRTITSTGTTTMPTNGSPNTRPCSKSNTSTSSCGLPWALPSSSSPPSQC
mmetsp:Transcript_15740/g.44122  ORF Transcript_15740/g.44122 Transcript_15740/m.44122 type:complete len:201 (+) Transcript_15740:339-941(+)